MMIPFPISAPLEVIIDDSRGQRKYARLLGRFSNFQPVMEGPVAKLVQRAINQQFNTRGRYGGSPWVALAESTIEKKTRAGVVGKGPLRFTDAMRDELIHPTDNVSVEDLPGERGKFVLRSTVRNENDGFPYGASHQTGTSDGHVPMRQIFPDPPPASFMRDLRRIIRGHLITLAFGDDE